METGPRPTEREEWTRDRKGWEGTWDPIGTRTVGVPGEQVSPPGVGRGENCRGTLPRPSPGSTDVSLEVPGRTLRPRRLGPRHDCPPPTVKTGYPDDDSTRTGVRTGPTTPLQGVLPPFVIQCRRGRWESRPELEVSTSDCGRSPSLPVHPLPFRSGAPSPTTPPVDRNATPGWVEGQRRRQLHHESPPVRVPPDQIDLYVFHTGTRSPGPRGVGPTPSDVGGGVS